MSCKRKYDNITEEHPQLIPIDCIFHNKMIGNNNLLNLSSENIYRKKIKLVPLYPPEYYGEISKKIIEKVNINDMDIDE